jgi:hypothetical protein
MVQVLGSTSNAKQFTPKLGEISLFSWNLGVKDGLTPGRLQQGVKISTRLSDEWHR